MSTTTPQINNSRGLGMKIKILFVIVALVLAITYLSGYFQMWSRIERTSTSQHSALKDNIGRLVVDRNVGKTSNTVDQASTTVEQTSNTEGRASNIVDITSNILDRALDTIDRASNTASRNRDSDTQQIKSRQYIDMLVDFTTEDTFGKRLNDTNTSNKLLPESGELSREKEKKNTLIIEPEAKTGNGVTFPSEILGNTTKELDNETKLTEQKLLPDLEAEALRLIERQQTNNINNGLIEEKLPTMLRKPKRSKTVQRVAKAILQSLNISSSNYSTEIRNGTNKLSNDAVGNIMQELMNKNLSSMIVSAVIQIIVHPKGTAHNYTLHKQLWIDYKSKQNASSLLQNSDKYGTTKPGDSLQNKFQDNYQQRQYMDNLQRPTYTDKYQQRPLDNYPGQGYRDNRQLPVFRYNLRTPIYIQDPQQPRYVDDRQQARFTNDNQQQKYKDDSQLSRLENPQQIYRDDHLLPMELGNTRRIKNVP